MDARKKIKLQGWLVVIIGGIYVSYLEISFYTNPFLQEKIWFPGLFWAAMYILVVLLAYRHTLKRLKKLDEKSKN